MHPTERVIMNRDMLFGCDPELFFTTKAGKVVGSERVIPEQMPVDHVMVNEKAIVQDGIQVELNPKPDWCRAHVGNEISAIFKTLKAHLAKMDDIQISFNEVVEVDKDELARLSERSRTLGCMPSKNVYDKGASVTVSKDYRKRSAGGHLHFGLPKYLRDVPDSLAVMMDILVGNTSVLIDRDENAAERRKVYGRASEHRTPPHGFEYRTLSNFWLRSYPLMSLVMGLARLSIDTLRMKYYDPNEKRATHYGAYTAKLYNDSFKAKWDSEARIREYVNIDDIKNAINNNDLTLAKRNFEGVKQFITNHVPYQDSGLDTTKLEAFDYFIKKIDEDGLQYWFPTDPIEHWTVEYREGHNRGWETFLFNNVTLKMRAHNGGLI